MDFNILLLVLTAVGFISAGSVIYVQRYLNTKFKNDDLDRIVRYAVGWAEKTGQNLTGPEKREKVVAKVKHYFPDVDEERLDLMIEAFVQGLNK